MAWCTLLLSSGCTDGSVSEQAQTMASIESRMALPEGAHALSSYRRYYFSREDGLVGAVYVSDLNPGKEWVGKRERAPSVFDGGCSVVEVVFDPAKRTVRATCNGIA